MHPKKPRITPHQLELWSQEMADLYNSLEGEILRIIIKRLNSGYRDITMWQAQKSQELRLFNNDVARYVSEVTNVSETVITKMFEEAGKRMIDDVDNAMSQAFEKKPYPEYLDQIMRGYRNQVWSEIDNYVNQTLISTNYGYGTVGKAYTDVLNRTTAMFNTGLYTFEQSLERSIMELAQKGIDSVFVDRGGHIWSLERYVRTVLKSTLSNTYDEVRKERMAEYGVYTVLVTSHAGARDACSIIQGNVVDLRHPHELPANWPYRSIYDPYWKARYEEPSGHRGINCRHLHIPFIPGVNTNNQPHFDEELNERVAKATQRQRQIEREIVKYKKNLMVAEHLGSENASYWRSMVSRRQKAMREHIAENSDYLSRNYKREKVYTPLSTLLKDMNFYDDGW